MRGKGRKSKSKETSKIKSTGRKSETPKKKKQTVQDEVDTTRKVLKREEKLYQLLYKASLEILKGTVGRPINKKLQEIQSEYEAKREELFGEIIASSKKMDESIKKAIEKEMQGIEKFEERLDKKFRSEDLDDSMSLRTIKMYGKTFLGSITARMAKMPYTLAARYQALKGDTEKQEELLFKASKSSRKVIERLRSKNRKFARDTEARTDTFNKVDDATTHYREREAKLAEAEKSTKTYIDENKEGDFRKKISLRLSNFGTKRTFVSNRLAEGIEEIGNFIARKSAIRGHLKIANSVAQKTVQASDYIMDRAIQKNAELYGKTASILKAHQVTKDISIRTRKEISISEFSSTAAANNWARARQKSLKARGIKLANKAITSTNKFLATSDMKISEFYARAISNMGLSGKAQDIMEKASERSKKHMNDAIKINQDIREKFGFSVKRRRNVESSKSFIEILKNGITISSKDSKGELSSWLEDIESKKTQQKVKRKFTSSGKKVGVLELLEKRSKGVLSNVEGSLYGPREARAAAQIDLDMNPENESSNSREDR